MINDPILILQKRDRTEMIREIFHPTINLVETFIKEFDILNIFVKIRMMRLLKQAEVEFADNLKDFLLDKISNVINMTLTSYQTLLDEPLEDDALETLYWSLLQEIAYTPFYHLTLEQRIIRSVRHTFGHIETLTHTALIYGSSKPEGSNPNHLIRDIKSCFLSTGQVSGGSGLLWMTRILVGEQNRAHQLAAKAFMKKAGITKAKWIQHPDKPMSTVCTGHEGIYLLNELPEYPYPGCTCSLEPLYK